MGQVVRPPPTRHGRVGGDERGQGRDEDARGRRAAGARGRPAARPAGPGRRARGRPAPPRARRPPGPRRRRATRAAPTGRAGRRCAARCGHRPACRSPTGPSPRTSMGSPMTAGAVLSSSPYMPMPAPSRPVRVRAPVTPTGGRRLLGAAAVAARVHRRGERQRPVEGVLQDGQRDPADRPDPCAALATEHPGAPDPLDALGELGRDGDRDDDRGADLVQGAGQGAQQPLGVGQGVGCADAGDQARQPQAFGGGGEQALEVERAEQGDAGQLDAGQRVEPDGAELVAHDDVQQRPAAR